MAIAGVGSIIALFSTTLLEIAVAALLLGAVAATLVSANGHRISVEASTRLQDD